MVILGGVGVLCTVGLCLGPYGGPRGGAVSYERGTPVVAQGAQLSVERRGERDQRGWDDDRGTSLIKKNTSLGPYRRPMPRVLGGS